MISVVVISKDEESLDDTLAALTKQVDGLDEPVEVVVVDASAGRLDHIRRRHSDTVHWLDFQPLQDVRVTIPHQRNLGVRNAQGEVIVFTDAGCMPSDGWLARMTAPLRLGESAVAGTSRDMSGELVFPSEHIIRLEQIGDVSYLAECPTLNFAFTRAAYDALGGFDESFAYGSDVDFTWRLNDSGYKVRYVPDASIEHDYGASRRQRRRSYIYGKARARLYKKHRTRRRNILRNDPMVIAYPLFLLGLPLTLIFPLYPLLLLIPAWRNRSDGIIRVLVDHLWFGAGVLAEVAGR
jgi:cellulose synthase/poly-beta-1,6-N-acetylglucosamine synthase-like glycosyltransferase